MGYVFGGYEMSRYTKVFAVLVIFAVLLTGCGANSGERRETTGTKGNTIIVTSFYPMYIHTINITKDIPGVQVVNLTGPTTGCLHDYQFTTENLKTLEKAKIFVINGAGMESFMDKVVSQLPDLKIVEASKGMDLIKNTGGQEEPNPHVWVSISGAMAQVKSIEEQLSVLDPVNASGYNRNAEEYENKLLALKDKMHAALDGIKDRDIITFHEAFPYFAKEFNLSIAAVIEREPGSEPSAGELAETINIVKSRHVKAIFAEPQYPVKSADAIARETGIKVYSLDPAVTGPDDTDAYLNIMENNLKVLEEALK